MSLNAAGSLSLILQASEKSVIEGLCVCVYGDRVASELQRKVLVVG